MPEQAYKQCTRCDETKPLWEFSRSRREKDGRQSRCKLCQAALTGEWIRANPEKVAERRKRWNKENPGRTQTAKQRHRERHPDKQRARAAVNRAIQSGELKKPDRCEDCGQTIEAHRLHGHHEDYSKLLEVEWLCHGCHMARH